MCGYRKLQNERLARGCLKWLGEMEALNWFLQFFKVQKLATSRYVCAQPTSCAAHSCSTTALQHITHCSLPFFWQELFFLLEKNPIVVLCNLLIESTGRWCKIICRRVRFKSGWAFRVGFGLKLVKMFRADFGPANKMFSQWRTLLSPVTVEAIELIKPSMKKFNCELFSYACFATPLIPRSCACLDSIGKFGLRA